MAPKKPKRAKSKSKQKLAEQPDILEDLDDLQKRKESSIQDAEPKAPLPPADPRNSSD
jgi:hypothetical protein